MKPLEPRVQTGERLNLLVLRGVGATDIVSRHLADVLGEDKHVNLILTETPQRMAAARVGFWQFLPRFARFLTSVWKHYQSGYLYLPSQELARYLWLLPGKKVVQVYDVVPLLKPSLMDHRASTLSRILASLDLLGLGSARIVCATSEGLEAELQAVGISPSRIRIVHLGLSLITFNPRSGHADETLSTPAEDFALYVGSGAPKKNLETLILGFGILVKDYGYAKMSLVLIGLTDQIEVEHLLDVARGIGVGSKVRVVGRIPQAALAGYYRRALVYIQPSVYEGFSITMLEAAACGTPVVAARVRGNMESLGDCALYFDPEAPDDLALKLSVLLRDAGIRAKLIDCGLRRTSPLSWENMGQTVLNMCIGAERR